MRRSIVASDLQRTLEQQHGKKLQQQQHNPSPCVRLRRPNSMRLLCIDVLTCMLGQGQPCSQNADGEARQLCCRTFEVISPRHAPRCTRTHQSRPEGRYVGCVLGVHATGAPGAGLTNGRHSSATPFRKGSAGCANVTPMQHNVNNASALQLRDAMAAAVCLSSSCRRKTLAELAGCRLGCVSRRQLLCRWARKQCSESGVPFCEEAFCFRVHMPTVGPCGHCCLATQLLALHVPFTEARL
jgi:hypothetical protein